MPATNYLTGHMVPVSNSRMRAETARIASRVRAAESVIVVSHIDADGIAAASIAASALERASIEYEVQFFKKLDDAAVESIISKSYEALIWLTDLGSSHSSRFSGENFVITDHHHTSESEFVVNGSSEQAVFLPYECNYHLNPHLFGYSGDRDISGSGLALLVALELSQENEDLVKLAIIGAIGDMQDSDMRRLTGLNSEIAKFGVKSGWVERKYDLRLFGTQTRPIQRLIEYCSDPIIPGLTGDGPACEDFLRSLKIPLTAENGEPKRWCDLRSGEKRRIITGLSRRILESGGMESDVERLMGEVYTFPDEELGSPLREAREFSTLLNSCGRNDMPELAVEICRGDRETALEDAYDLLRTHRENISNAINFVRQMGVGTLGAVQHFHCADQVKDTIVGVIAGMMLGSGELDASKPVVGFAISKEADGRFKIKASIRGSRHLVDRGLNLASAVRTAAESVSGVGGGHSVAAGATLPLGSEDQFLAALEAEISRQLSG